MRGGRSLYISEAELLVQGDMPLFAHQVDGFLSQLPHAQNVIVHQYRRKSLAMKFRMNHHGHDYIMFAVGIVADQFLEALIRHFNLIGGAGVDEADNSPSNFNDHESIRINRDALRDLFPRCGLVSFV